MSDVSSPAAASAAIKAVQYNPATRQLRVTFPNGNIYKYYDVPRGVYENFADADSKGLYFNRYIRDRYDFALAA